MAVNVKRNGLSNWIALTIFLSMIFLIMVGYKPTELPRPWFDEGWTLSTAKNWAENGVYALKLEDKWISPEAMAQPLPVTLPVAVSLRMFGVGILQARLPGILFTIGSLALIFLLAQQIYNTKVAWGMLFYLLLFAPAPDVQPMVFGRQALGEMPMLFYLLAGYWFLGRALKKDARYSILVILFWGLGVASKRQALPFWLLSWIIPVCVALWQRNWRVVKIISIAGVLAGATAMGLSYVNSLVDKAWPLYGTDIVQKVYSMAVWVWDRDIRVLAFKTLISVGFSTLVGLLYAGFLLVKKLLSEKDTNPVSWVELSLFIFASSWMAWFLLGSLAWLRYFAPLFVVSSIFFAKLIHDYTDGYNVRGLFKSLASVVYEKEINKTTLPGITASILAIILIGSGTKGWKSSLEQITNSPYLAANYINTSTPKDSLIETYESELFFLLDRPYHYPPPEVQVELNLRTFLKSDATIHYKPMQVDPDYIIVGPFSRDWGLYKQLVNSGRFSLIKKFPNYSIYQQNR